MKKAYVLKLAAVLGLVWCWLVMGGCGESLAPYAGTYSSEKPYAGKGHIEVVLKEDGTCTWTLEGKALEFKWRVQDGRIWIYTKEGAIIIVTPSEGGKTLSADMSGDWHPGCPPEKCIIFKRVK